MRLPVWLSPKYVSITLVVLLVAVGAALCLLAHLHAGATAIGAAPAVAGLYRLRYPAKQVPWVVSRNALFDVVTAFALAAAVWAVTWVVPQ